MPRPSKYISPDTLGGRIRAARERLHLSLADVANGHYSTSLISQIERNRIEPSQESLRFLANRLKLPLEDLEILAKQHHNAEFEAHQYKSFEELCKTVNGLLVHKDTTNALHLLQDLYFLHIPSAQRWRLAALRGRCYFEQRQFLKAQQDFVYAITEIPVPQSKWDLLPNEQKHELMLLHLHLAASYRELQQLDAALEHYKTTLQMINSETPFGYVAEAHWGIALITYAQAHRYPSTTEEAKNYRDKTLRIALEHAENARYLYRSIGEQLRATAVTCQIAQIEQTLGEITKVRIHLEEVLSTWNDMFTTPCPRSKATSASLTTPITPPDSRRSQEIASIISAAACTMANLELEAKNYPQALAYVNRALAAGKSGYKLRRADAYIMHGRVLEAIDPYNPEVTEAFRHATEELADTQRFAARISAHVRYGKHLLRIGNIEEGEQELEQANRLSDLVSAGSNTSAVTDDILPA